MLDLDFLRNLLDAINRSKYRKSIYGVIVILSITFFSISIYRDTLQLKEQEYKRQENLSYVTQQESLKNVQDSLNNLMSFVESERQKLKESEDLVNNLKQEQEKLKPLVETDRQVIEAVLNLQAEKSRSNVWTERWIGFGFGIISSIIASFLFALIGRFSKKLPPEALPVTSAATVTPDPAPKPDPVPVAIQEPQPTPEEAK